MSAPPILICIVIQIDWQYILLFYWRVRGLIHCVQTFISISIMLLHSQEALLVGYVSNISGECIGLQSTFLFSTMPYNGKLLTLCLLSASPNILTDIRRVQSPIHWASLFLMFASPNQLMNITVCKYVPGVTSLTKINKLEQICAKPNWPLQVPIERFVRNWGI